MPNFSLWLDDESRERFSEVLAEVAVSPHILLPRTVEPYDRFLSVVHPGEGPVRYIATFLVDAEAKSLKLHTSNPVAETSSSHRLYVESARVNEETGEALLLARLGGESGPTLNFFDPIYGQHHRDYEMGSGNDILLAGIVLGSETGFETETKITEGPLLQKMHERDLEEDPDAEFPECITMDMSELRCLVPWSREGEEDAAQFQTRVDRLERLENPFGKGILRFDAVGFRGGDSDILLVETDVRIPFYLNPRFNEGPPVEEGLLIRGNVWLHGRPAKSPDPFAAEHG